MRFLINADDYGLSQGITDNILDAFDHGALSGTSLIANGAAFDYAITEFKKRAGLRLAIHLNLVEGRPLLPKEEVAMLVNQEGDFCHSFQTLWWQYLQASQQNRRILQKQIQQEMAAQIRKVQKCFDQTFKINIDSHLHYHLLPFVFDALLELHQEFCFSYVRLPEERLFILKDNLRSLKNYASLNPVKNVLLALLSKRNRDLLLKQNIASCDYFVGILFSGKMTETVVRSALSQIDLSQDDSKLCEILFHPGRALAAEKGMRPAHYSSWRQTECDTLKSESFRQFIKTLQTQI